MDQVRLTEFRKKQWLYTNIIYLLYLCIICFFIMIKVSGWVVYVFVGMIFFISAVAGFFFKIGNPILLLFPGMRDISNYERGKLGEAWRQYHLVTLLLQLLLALFSFSQAWVKGQQVGFLQGIPLWYWIVAVLLLVYMGNLNLRFHIRRFDQKSNAQLVEFAKDQSLFTLILIGVMAFFTLVGFFLVYVVFG